MFGITFLLPAVLYAGAAVAAPVLIHLILRTKPRRVVFPALRFVKKTHQASLNMLRLKHLILLAMRMLAIALLVVLVARTEIPGWFSVEDRSSPVAAVIVVDNSGSMNYRQAGRTLLDRGKSIATSLIESMPARSRVAVVASSDPAAGGGFSSDKKLAAQHLADVSAGFGAQPVDAAIDKAMTLLAKEEMLRKEVFIVSDMTARGFGGALDLKQYKDDGFTIIDVNPGENANIALGEAKPAERAAPVGAELRVETVVSSAHFGGEMKVLAELDSQVMDQQTAQLPAGGSASVALKVRPQKEGLAQGRIILRQDDPLEMDNQRYFTLDVGRPAKLVMASDPSETGGTAFLMANGISPAGAGKESWVERVTVPAEKLDAAAMKDAKIVMLANVSRLSPDQWAALEQYVRRGGRLWVVAGSLMSVADYDSAPAQRLMPAAITPLEQLEKAVGWRSEDRTDAMLAPFAGDENPPLSEVECYRRFGVQTVGPDTAVVMHYQDGVPAILQRKIGEGVCLFWNFSPLRTFSNIGTFPHKQFPILALWTARVLARGEAAGASYYWGQGVSIPLPQGMASPAATVRRPGGADESALPDYRLRTLRLAADRLGIWTVQFAEADRRETVGFSVNVDPAESDLTAAGKDALAAAFPPGRLAVVTSADAVNMSQRTGGKPLDLATPLLLAVLALLTAESFFANRFYRRGQQANSPAQN